MRRAHKYADGGKIVKDHTAKKPRRKLKPEALGTGLAATAGKKIRSRAQQIEDQLKAAGG